jgi:hypothetical protein
MSCSIPLLSFLLYGGILYGLSVPFAPGDLSSDSGFAQPDTLKQDQILYNGREWRNLYLTVEGDQFFLSREFLWGSLTIEGKDFTRIRLKYDLYQDEILTPMAQGIILQLNKERVDSFSLAFQNKTYRFVRIPERAFGSITGYAQVIYRKETALYVKYIKKIDRPAIENNQDRFYQFSRIFMIKEDGSIHLITRKRDLFTILEDENPQLRDFVRKNKIRMSKNDPESFVPVVRFYDSINH